MKAAPTIVLLPGMDGTGRLFRPFGSAAPAGFSTKVLSYPGDRFLSYDELTDRVQAELQNHPPFVPLGESFSGPIAVRLAQRKPGGLRGVILCNSFVSRPVCRCAGLLPWRLLFRLPPPRWVLRRFLLGPGAPDDLIREAVAAVGSVAPGVLAKRVRAILAVDVRNELRSLDLPVLYLRGTQDRLVSARSLREVLATGRRVEEADVPGPHLLLQTAPEESWRVIQSFVNRRTTG